MANKKFVVTHPKLYMNVDGKLAHVASGTEVSMSEVDAKSLLKKGKLLEVGSGKKVKVGSGKKAEDIA